jgi:hypothetical protein
MNSDCITCGPAMHCLACQTCPSPQCLSLDWGVPLIARLLIVCSLKTCRKRVICPPVKVGRAHAKKQ